jgi:hypothetical protein
MLLKLFVSALMVVVAMEPAGPKVPAPVADPGFGLTPITASMDEDPRCAELRAAITAKAAEIAALNAQVQQKIAQIEALGHEIEIIMLNMGLSPVEKAALIAPLIIQIEALYDEIDVLFAAINVLLAQMDAINAELQALGCFGPELP